MLQQLTGLFLGIILAFIYVHYAWYTRDTTRHDVRKNVKIKALTALLGQNGIAISYGYLFKETATFAAYTNVSTLGSITVILVAMMISGFAIGFLSEPFEQRKLASGINSLYVTLFQGWKALVNGLEDRAIKIERESKLSLSRIAIDSEEVLSQAREVKPTLRQFKRSFESLTGMILYTFFQHDSQNHPDYCAVYYKWHEGKGRFIPVGTLSGHEKYRVDKNTILGEKSYAYQSFMSGRLSSWNRDNQKEDSIAPSPEVRKQTSRFICIPVPPGENIEQDRRSGVLTVDCAKPGWQFDDAYHRNILRWLAYRLDDFDQLLLKDEKEWKLSSQEKTI